MQQATAQIPDASAPSGASPSPGTLRNLFVINLCASTTPVSLTPPDHAGLKRFTFFVSRRREEGRERFRLHMGYFESQEEAEKLLDIVREIYPGAWAGISPGLRLRAKAQAEAQVAAASVATAAGEVADTAQAAAQSSADSARLQPMAAAAAPATPATPAAPATAVAHAAPAAAIAASAPAAVVTPEAQLALVAPLALVTESALALVPDEGRRVADLAQSAHENVAAAHALSNVRAAIASLDDTGASVPTLVPLSELKRATTTGTHSALTLATTGVYKSLAAGASPAPAATEASRDLSESAALSVLESKTDAAGGTTIRQPRLETPAGAAPKASADARPRDEKTAFAVQLLWSVQPIDIAQIPQLAIFSAYTLYGAEGNRDGRRWYGVRLGFFTDAVSAKQVAHYVRSDFSTVSVVPVTVRERERAKLAATRPDATPVAAAAAAPAATAAPSAATPAAKAEADKATKPGFEFIEDNKPAPKPGAAAADANALRSARGAPGKRAKLRTGRQVNGRAKSKPMTLEETLEILGAGQLQMDDGRKPLINDTAHRASSSEPAKGKPSRFGRLLERLSERLGS